MGYLGHGVFACCVGNFYKASTVSPGRITAENVNRVVELFPHDEFIYADPEAKCRTCLTIKPARSHHCRMCDFCVARFDHHCVWVNQCIGLGNYRWFLAFVASNALICAYGAFLFGAILLTNAEDLKLFQ